MHDGFWSSKVMKGSVGSPLTWRQTGIVHLIMEWKLFCDGQLLLLPPSCWCCVTNLPSCEGAAAAAAKGEATYSTRIPSPRLNWIGEEEEVSQSLTGAAVPRGLTLGRRGDEWLCCGEVWKCWVIHQSVSLQWDEVTGGRGLAPRFFLHLISEKLPLSSLCCHVIAVELLSKKNIAEQQVPTCSPSLVPRWTF